MELGSFEFQIFLGLVVVLGAVFVALVCDFLKGNNEQLRERNIELRVRQDERERLGFFQPLSWLQGLAALARNPGVAESLISGGTVPVAGTPPVAGAAPVAARPPRSAAAAPTMRHSEPLAEAETRAPSMAAGPAPMPESGSGGMRRRHYDEAKSQAAAGSWASREELELLAGRAARIRARHEGESSGGRVAEPPAEDRSVAEGGHVAPQKGASDSGATEQRAGPSVQRAAPEPAAAAPVAQPGMAVEETPSRAESEQDAEYFRPSFLTTEAAKPSGESRVEQPAAESLPQNDDFEELPPEVPEISRESPARARIGEPEQTETSGEYASLRWQLNPSVPETQEEAMAAEAAEAELERSTDEVKIKVLPIDVNAGDRFEVVEEEEEPLRETGSQPVAPWLTSGRTESAAGGAGQQSSAEPSVFPTRLDLGRIANPEVHFDVAPAAEDKTQFELTDRGPAEGAPVEALTAPTEAGASGEGGPQEQAVARAPEPEGQLDLPTGLQDPSVMERLLQSAAPFHGVAVAIGINDYQSLKEKLQASSDNDSIGAVNRMIQSLLRPQDFAVRFVEDEYILLYPGESGAAAQRRLFQVSEKLWDFQLRSLGHLSVMFSWGGLEVANETVAEAVASARERMYQTKRNRKSTADIGISRRRVVNG